MDKALIDENLIERLALFSSIQLSPGERKSLRADLQDILSYVERLGTLSPESAAASAQTGNILQSDVPEPGLGRKGAFQNAPETRGPFFKAPPIIERKRTNEE